MPLTRCMPPCASPVPLPQVLPAEGERHQLKEQCPPELAGEGAGYK